MTVGFRIGAGTDVGAQRELNQDSYGVLPRLAVVADGMGGHRGGEVASSLAVEEMLTRFDSPSLESLKQGVDAANQRILDESASNLNLRGMGTTVVALALIDAGHGGADRSVAAINVGDSRMYRIADGVLEQLTRDHSLVEEMVREGRITPEEAKTHPRRNVVTRALGVFEHIDIDDFEFAAEVGDRYLLCSDGLSTEVGFDTIRELLVAQVDPQAAAASLIAAANAGGGRDNITTVVVDIVEAADAQVPDAATMLAVASVDTSDSTVAAGEGGLAEVDHAADPFDRPRSGRRARGLWPWRR